MSRTRAARPPSRAGQGRTAEPSAETGAVNHSASRRRTIDARRHRPLIPVEPFVVRSDLLALGVLKAQPWAAPSREYTPHRWRCCPFRGRGRPQPRPLRPHPHNLVRPARAGPCGTAANGLRTSAHSIAPWGRCAIAQRLFARERGRRFTDSSTELPAISVVVGDRARSSGILTSSRLENSTRPRSVRCTMTS